jgi:hypothetical protein
MDVWEIGREEDEVWVNLAQDTTERRAVMNTVMN